MVNRGYNRKDLISLQADMAKVIMRYLTLDNHFTSIFSYHFMMLNHCRHDRRISLLFYLLSSLEHSLANHVKNGDNLILHAGLTMIIMEYDKPHGVKSSPIVKTPKSSTSPDVQVIFDTETEEERDGMAMEQSDLNMLDDPDYCPSNEDASPYKFTLGTNSSTRNKHPRLAPSKFKTPTSKPQGLGPCSKKTKLGKIGESKGRI